MKSIASWIARAFVFLLPLAASAQNPIVPCDGIKTKCEVKHIFTLLTNIYNYLLLSAALVAMLMIIWAGIQMLIYNFDEQPQQALEGAKNTFRRAVFGLVIIILAYVIVNTLLVVVLGVDQDKVQGIFGGALFN